MIYVRENYYKEVKNYPQMIRHIESIPKERIIEIMGLKIEVTNLRVFHSRLVNMYRKIIKRILRKEKSFQVKLDI